MALSCTASSLAMTSVARAVSEEQRSKVLGIVSAAGSLGTLLVPLTTRALLARQTWQIGVLFFLILAAVMLPAAFLAGGADQLPGAGFAKTTMREMIGQAARHRPFLVMSGGVFRLRPEIWQFAAKTYAERRSSRGNRRDGCIGSLLAG